MPSLSAVIFIINTMVKGYGGLNMATIVEAISDNFILIFLSILVFIVLIFLIRMMMIYLEGRKFKIKAQYEMDIVNLIVVSSM